MMLGAAALAGIVAGKLSGGSLRSLAMAPVRGAWLFLLGFAVQVVIFTPVAMHNSWVIHHAAVLYLASLLLLLAGLAINLGRLRRPILILTVGAALNFTVIAANGGAMPVQGHLLSRWGGAGLVDSLRHHRFASNVAVAGPGSRFSLLEDRLALPSPAPFAPFSVGDVLIFLGGFWVIVAEMRARTSPVTVTSPQRHPRSVLNTWVESLRNETAKIHVKGEGA